jgi:hypothetical protein
MFADSTSGMVVNGQKSRTIIGRKRFSIFSKEMYTQHQATSVVAEELVHNGRHITEHYIVSYRIGFVDAGVGLYVGLHILARNEIIIIILQKAAPHTYTQLYRPNH